MEIINSYKALKGTLFRTLIYTLGHFIIAASCVMVITGADFITAMTDAVVEPLINALWFFILDRLWISNGD